MSFNLTVHALEFWLQQPEYALPNISMTRAETNDSNYKLMESNNSILGRSFHHTFSKWYKSYKRIPTPQEFIAMQMNDVKKNYNTPAWRRNHKATFQWTATVEKGIKQRLLRSYVSFINEIHTELMIQDLYPRVTIQRSDELDYSGIDILAVDSKIKVTHEIHITKNSPYAIDFLFKKEGKELCFRRLQNKLWAYPCWNKINHSIYSKRNFKGHVFLLYDNHETYSTKIINGYPLFKKEYILNKLDTNCYLKVGA